MSSRYKRLFAWVSLVAIVVVHLRLDALALQLSAAATEDQPRGCCAACCQAETSQPASPSTSQHDASAPEEHGDGRPSHPCPCCPQKDCSDCCVFCIYAKAPCGPTTSLVSALPADEIVAVVADPSAHAPIAPVDEFFQPPRA